MVDEVEGEIFGSSRKSGGTITSMSATSDPDTMYFHQAMKEKDADKFLDAAKTEFQQLLDDGTFEIVRKGDVPAGHKLFPAVWAMKRSRLHQDRLLRCTHRLLETSAEDLGGVLVHPAHSRRRE